MVESAESRKDYTIEIFTKKGELIHEESMKVGDIKVNISRYRSRHQNSHPMLSLEPC